MSQCPKCQMSSGNDWSQCERDCPMPMSPHYKKSPYEVIAEIYEKVENLDPSTLSPGLDKIVREIIEDRKNQIISK